MAYLLCFVHLVGNLAFLVVLLLAYYVVRYGAFRVEYDLAYSACPIRPRRVIPPHHPWDGCRAKTSPKNLCRNLLDFLLNRLWRLRMRAF